MFLAVCNIVAVAALPVQEAALPPILNPDAVPVKPVPAPLKLLPLITPTTCNGVVGSVVDIPTLPLAIMVILSKPFVYNLVIPCV